MSLFLEYLEKVIYLEVHWDHWQDIKGQAKKYISVFNSRISSGDLKMEFNIDGNEFLVDRTNYEIDNVMYRNIGKTLKKYYYEKIKEMGVYEFLKFAYKLKEHLMDFSKFIENYSVDAKNKITLEIRTLRNSEGKKIKVGDSEEWIKIIDKLNPDIINHNFLQDISLSELIKEKIIKLYNGTQSIEFEEVRKVVANIHVVK